MKENEKPTSLPLAAAVPFIFLLDCLKKMYLDLSEGNILKHSVLIYPQLDIDLTVHKAMHITLEKIHLYVFV